MKKIISVFEEGLWEFDRPEKFSNAEEAHPTEGWFNLLDGDVSNPETEFIGFIDGDAMIREVE